jgi:1-acyl-sn-glycerol-3-phosphate acyltransferase
MYVPTLGDRLPRRGNRLTRAAGRWVLRLWGWRFEGVIPDHPKMVVIAAPHTTAWDFIVGMVAIFAIGIRVSWLGADWVFRFPMMRSLGGVPVDRSRRHDLVARTVETFAGRERHVLALSPEGTRSKRVPWKTGFYHIARGAGVPVFLAAIDQRAKRLILGPSFLPSGDYEADMEAHIRPFYAEYLDKYPERFGI